MNTKVSPSQIVEYYDTCEIDYRMIWNLDSSRAMHYGYWDEKVETFAQALERENEILANKAVIKKSDRVLDAGCGVGGSSIYLAKKIGCKVVGITLSKKQTERANQNAQKEGVAHAADFQVKDFTNTGFPADSFDVVWAVESVCHADDKSKFVNEAYRILKKGGRLILADFFSSKKPEKHENTLMKKWLRGWAVNSLESLENFHSYMKNTGFKNVSCVDETKYIVPSSKRLYMFFFPGILFAKLAEFLRMRNKVQTDNVMTAYYQYIALRKRFWRYGICYGEKQ